MDTADTRDNKPSIERISGGHNQVLVLRTKDSEATIVVPPGVREHEWLANEAEQKKCEAASLFERAHQLSARAKHLQTAAGLCDPSN